MNNFKKRIIAAGIKKHQSVIDDFKQRIKELMKTDVSAGDEEYDSQVQSQRAEVLSEASLLADQLQFAGKELEELKRIESSPDGKFESAAFGTVVVTDRKTFFVSTGIEEFDVDGKSLFGLSVYSPLYRQMRGKRVGDKFTYGNTTYTIKEIF